MLQLVDLRRQQRVEFTDVVRQARRIKKTKKTNICHAVSLRTPFDILYLSVHRLSQEHDPVESN